MLISTNLHRFLIRKDPRKIGNIRVPMNSGDQNMADETILLAVNGTLMRGLALNGNLTGVGATFVCEDATCPAYRLYSIDDIHPAMQRMASGGASIALEVWAVPVEGVVSVLRGEPAGLCMGKIELADRRIILGVLGEALLCARGKEITEYGGWRAYVASIHHPPHQRADGNDDDSAVY